MNLAAKILGILLLFTGVIIIIGTLYFSYNIFTAKSSIPEILKIEIPQTSLHTETAESSDIQTKIENIAAEQIKGLFPAEALTKMINLIALSVLAGIFIFGGTQISSIGIKLIK